MSGYEFKISQVFIQNRIGHKHLLVVASLLNPGEIPHELWCARIRVPIYTLGNKTENS